MRPAFAFMADELPPMAFDQDPTIATMFPAMGFPDGAGMLRTRPMAVDPDIAVAIPAVIAVDPHPSFVRRTIVRFVDGRGRRDVNHNSYLSHHGRGRHTKSKQR